MNKFGLIVCALVCAISSNASGSFWFGGGYDRNSPVIEGILEEIKPVAINLISRTFIQRWRKSGGVGARQSIIPDLPDPLLVDGEFDFEDLELDFLRGVVSLKPGSVEGLSTVVDDFRLQLTIPARAIFEATATEILAYGDYTADVEVELGDTLINATGGGCLTAQIWKPEVNIVVNILVNGFTNRVSITGLTIDLGFESLFVRADEFVLNGDLIDWEWFDDNAKPLFDWAWEMLKPEVETGVKDLLNEILKDCPFLDLVGGDFSCLMPPPFLSSTFQDFNLQPSGRENNILVCSPATRPPVAATTPVVTDGPTNEPEPTDGPTDPPTTAGALGNSFRNMSIAILAAALFKLIVTL